MHAYASILCGVLSALVLSMAGLFLVPSRVASSVASQETRRATIGTKVYSAQAIAPAYLLQGDVGVNVRAALKANGGALQAFTIRPGETWSFGHSIAPISAMGPLAYAGGVYGGGLCDLSAEYLKVAQQLGLEARYVQHAGVSGPFPSIWLNEQGDGESGQDLTVYNPTPAPVTFRARVEDGALIIEGGMG